jgi:16S rRNA (cytidine1402-2'-O)-methyltransferase
MNQAASGTLYVVATPIGNLDDITARAVKVLRDVDVIIAEDTRVSGTLLRHFGITTSMEALHAHNEHQRSRHFLAMLQSGRSLALISDAGTPLVSDPGFLLVRSAREAGMPVVPIPGPSSIIAALSVAGLPVDRFCFEGFLPAAAGPRRAALEALLVEQRTMVFLEAPHRVLETLVAMKEVFGDERQACLAREITKRFETIVTRPLSALVSFVGEDADQQRGEIVLCVAGAPAVTAEIGEGLRVARVLQGYLSPSQSAAAAAEITGVNRKEIYRGLVDNDAGVDGVP